MSIINAALLGIIQGFTEFFPVSSSGHLALLDSLFHMEGTGGEHLFFNALLHLGTLAAVLVVYWQDFVNMLHEFLSVLSGSSPAEKAQISRINARQFIMLCAAVLPMFIVLLFRAKLPALNNSVIIGVMMILNGCLMYACDKMTRGIKNEKNITLFDSLLIGLAQCAAAIPGISRVGTAAGAGIANGVSAEYSLKFAFLLSVPALFGSGILNLMDGIKAGFLLSNVPAYLVGVVCSILAGILSINIMKYSFRSGKFGYFSYYCWLIGSLSIVLTVIF